MHVMQGFALILDFTQEQKISVVISILYFI